MISTFLVELDHGSDTDLLSIAMDLEVTLNSAEFLVRSVKPWSHPTLEPTLQTPPDASG